MIVINGEPQDKLSALDRGLNYGDGLFETIAVINHEPLLWTLHMQRLEAGCDKLGIPFPGNEIFLSDLQKLNSAEKSVVKIILTRGTGNRGYAIPQDTIPNRIVIQSNWPEHIDNPHISGIKTRLCNMRLSSQPRLAGLKHLNRLEQVMARTEWNDSSIAEGLMMDQDDHLIEGIMSNVFVVIQGELHTPSLRHCGVQGVQRQHIMDIALEQDMNVYESDLHISNMTDFEEVFVTNSLIGIWPVTTIDSLSYDIGPITMALQHSLDHPV